MDLGDLLVMFVIGQRVWDDYKSGFFKKIESVILGYYIVEFDKYKVKVELIVMDYVVLYCYIYQNVDLVLLLFDL